VFDIESGALNGLAGFIAPAFSVIAGFALARMATRRAMTLGIVAAIVGSVGIIGGLLAGSLGLMFLGQAIAGVAFGASFTAALKLILPQAAPSERAGVIAAIYVVSYVAFGLPIIVTGQLIEVLGEVAAVSLYGGLTIVLAAVSLAAQIARSRVASTSR
jgi:MFS family permease